jgi:glutathione S-transferase
MDQVMNINDWYLFQGVCNVIAFERVIKPRLLKQPADEANVAQALPKGRTVFAGLSRLLGGDPYFAGESMSLADLLVAPQMDFLALTPEWKALSADTPNLVAWLDRMNERDSMKATTWERIAQLVAA